MRDASRRQFIKELGAIGLAASLVSSPAAGSPPDEASNLGGLRDARSLNGVWQFRLDPEGSGESQEWYSAEASADAWTPVIVPHTWQVSAASAEYQGVAWYRRTFEAPSAWADQVVRVEFESVYHSATVWLNGKTMGQHLGKGYTAFTLDLSPGLGHGKLNTLVVKVDSSFDTHMLPRGNSYDWAVDGGIVRPVNLLVTPPTFIERVDVDTQLDLDSLQAALDVAVVIQNTARQPVAVRLAYEIVEETTGRVVLRQWQKELLPLRPESREDLSFPTSTLPKPHLWHFDHPNLYRCVVEIEPRPGAGATSSFSTTFGVRKIEVKDSGFYLNGERVWLMGVERMAGSHPDYGMAEPHSWIVHDHNDLKELNAVFTRVHWPQDQRVLDYCDRKGILIQVEVPAWGAKTFSDMGDHPSPGIMQNGLEQLREMIHRDRNHPSIFAWGLCNEVNGQNAAAYQFAARMVQEAKKRDPHRLCSYASNSLEKSPERDVAGLMDFIEWNEYYETWYKGTVEDVRRNLEEIHRAFPDKTIVISEYGYCECTPDRTGGDAARIKTLVEHTNVYRELPYVGGAIFFCYNDYRTHMGDKGLGVMKQRVHGVVDLYGDRKPSFEALRHECSPVEDLQVKSEGGSLTASVVTRERLPAYTLAGYALRWIVYGSGDPPMEQHAVSLPRLARGQTARVPLRFQTPNATRIRVDVLRPTGFSARKTYWKP